VEVLLYPPTHSIPPTFLTISPQFLNGDLI